jgi:SAM-dependent methyltransferase
LSEIFAAYARYYDLLYADKDYAAETAFVREVVRRHMPSARSVLDLGCGSARHCLELVRSGFTVTGVDASPQMIAAGQEHAEKVLPKDLSERLTLVQGDVTRFVPATTYDAVLSLFHVVNYQTTNDALRDFFRTARAAVAPNGIFVFDFWYGQAVLSERPQVRIKRIQRPGVSVARIAEPIHDASRNLVHVNYTLIVTDQSAGRTDEIRETHAMRYLFLPEIDLITAAAGFKVVEIGEWFTGDRLHDRCWSGYVALCPINTEE